MKKWHPAIAAKIEKLEKIEISINSVERSEDGRHTINANTIENEVEIGFKPLTGDWVANGSGNGGYDYSRKGHLGGVYFLTRRTYQGQVRKITAIHEDDANAGGAIDQSYAVLKVQGAGYGCNNQEEEDD